MALVNDEMEAEMGCDLLLKSGVKLKAVIIVHFFESICRGCSFI